MSLQQGEPNELEQRRRQVADCGIRGSIRDLDAFGVSDGGPEIQHDSLPSANAMSPLLGRKKLEFGSFCWYTAISETRCGYYSHARRLG